MESDQLRQKIQISSILSDAEKKEWVFLLPKMNESQLLELERILSVQMPAELSTSPSIPPHLLGREVRGGASPQAMGSGGREAALQHHPSVIHPEPAPIPEERSRGEEASVTVAPSLNPSHKRREKTSDAEVGGLTVAAMRAASSLYEFLDGVAAKTLMRVRSKEISAEQATSNFQESPLYKAYVEAGKQMLMGQEPTALSRPEFEAVAEFRASLKKILSDKT